MQRQRRPSTHGCHGAEMRKVFNFRCGYLFNCQLCWGSCVGLDMFLKHESVWVALLADQTLVERAYWSAYLVHTHVCLEVALCCKASFADLAPVRPLSSVCPVVHLQSGFTREHFVTHDTLIRIRQLVSKLVNQMLQFARLTLLVNLNKVLPLLGGIFHLRRKHVRHHIGFGDREREPRHHLSHLRPEQAVWYLGERKERSPWR